MKIVVLGSYRDPTLGPRLAAALRRRGHSVVTNWVEGVDGEHPDVVVIIDTYLGSGSWRDTWMKKKLIPSGIPYILIHGRNELRKSSRRQISSNAVAVFDRGSIFLSDGRRSGRADYSPIYDVLDEIR